MLTNLENFKLNSDAKMGNYYYLFSYKNGKITKHFSFTQITSLLLVVGSFRSFHFQKSFMLLLTKQFHSSTVKIYLFIFKFRICNRWEWVWNNFLQFFQLFFIGSCHERRQRRARSGRGHPEFSHANAFFTKHWYCKNIPTLINHRIFLLYWLN